MPDQTDEPDQLDEPNHSDHPDESDQPDQSAPGAAGSIESPLGLDPWLLGLLVCPACRAAVRVDEPASALTCTGCGLAYPVRDGIPIMLVDEATR